MYPQPNVQVVIQIESILLQDTSDAGLHKGQYWGYPTTSEVWCECNAEEQRWMDPIPHCMQVCTHILHVVPLWNVDLLKFPCITDHFYFQV